MQADIMLAGKGNLAQVFVDACQTQNRPFFHFSPDTGDISEEEARRMVAVHVGSGRELLAMLDWCETNGVPLIQASTGMDLPADRNILIVDAPNLSIPIVKTMSRIVPVLQDALGSLGGNVSIMETHQASKTSLPGTAKTMAEKLGLAEEDIISIREPVIQLQIGVPPESLSGHGYHFITFQVQGVTITLTTKVNGRQTYAEGGLVIADALVRQGHVLENTTYHVTEVMALLGI